MFGGHCFYIKKMEVLCQKWECMACKEIFTQSTHLNSHRSDGSCKGGKPTLVCNGKKCKRELPACEKVLYGGESSFSYSACHWIDTCRKRQESTYITHFAVMVENALYVIVKVTIYAKLTVMRQKRCTSTIAVSGMGALAKEKIGTLLDMRERSRNDRGIYSRERL